MSKPITTRWNQRSQQLRLMIGRTTVAKAKVEDTNGPGGWIRNLNVAESYRRRGLGRRLVEEALQMARTGGCEGMGLFVAVDNAPAIALYRQTGFFIIATSDCRKYYVMAYRFNTAS